MTTTKNKKTKRTTESKTRSAKQPSVLVYGASGRMGVELIRQLQSHPSLILAGTVDSKEIRAIDDGHTAILKTTPTTLAAVLQGADIVIDFSSVSGTEKLSRALEDSSNLIVLIGTTGLPQKIVRSIERVAKKQNHRILMAGNTSLGVATLARLAVSAATMLAPAGFDIEIIETHHKMKTDSPSGTAILLATMLKESLKDVSVIFNRNGKRTPHTIGVHAVRGGGVVGEHEIRFISEFEEIKLSHRAFNRSLFADGALNLVREIERSMKPGTAKNLQEFLLSATN